ncbi:MAG: zinc-binding dehydrogenase [Saprospiraceae bacterium]
MKALLLPEKGAALQYTDVPDPKAGEGEVVIKLKTAALNHRDVFITQDLYPGVIFPCILGSDGAGTYQDREVIINPNNDWGDQAAFQSKAYHILGAKKPGTFAQYIAVTTSKLVDKPAHLTWEQAAALPLAGMTAYRALFTKAQVKPGDTVLITGIGGGVALFILQFALAIGARVFVTSSADEKLEKAMALGASGGANYKNADWDKQLLQQTEGFDIILDSAGGAGFTAFPKLCNPGGRIVVYGGTLGKIPNLSPQMIFWKQLSIHGSTMATDEEFVNMMQLVNEYQIVPVIDSVYDIANAPAAFARMDKGEQFGKIVFKIE